MSARIRILVVDDFAETRETVSKLLTLEPDIAVVGEAADASAALEAVRRLRPDVVLMDINMPGMDGIQATEMISAEAPETEIVMMSVQGELDYLRRAMVAGARDYLIKPFSPDELTAAVRRAYEYSIARRARAAGQTLGQPAREAAAQGRIVSVFGPKGGVGRTTVACNLAVAVRQLTGRRVTLVDASLALGDVGIMLNTEGRYAIQDLVPTSEELTAEIFDQVLVPHASGVKVLLAPPRPEMAELVTAEHMARILSALKDYSEYVIVDTRPSFDDVMLAVLDHSETILVLTVLDMPTVKNTRLFLEVCQALGYPLRKTQLVLNRADSTGGLSVDAIQESLRRSFAATLVSGGSLVTTSINRGTPFILSDPDARISHDIRTLARTILRPGDELSEGQSERAALPAEPRGISLSRLKVPVFTRRGGD